eukprot:scaffold10264_cov33-Tisochrysis_lutea.AAC.1
MLPHVRERSPFANVALDPFGLEHRRLVRVIQCLAPPVHRGVRSRAVREVDCRVWVERNGLGVRWEGSEARALTDCGRGSASRRHTLVYRSTASLNILACSAAFPCDL